MAQFVRNRLNNINNTTVFLILIAFAAGSLWGSHVLNGAEFQWMHEFFPDLGLALQSTWNALTTNSDWSSGFWQNFSTEMMGAIITFALFELILGTRQEEEQKQDRLRLNDQLQKFIQELNQAADERAEKELKESLLARAKSRNNAVAVGAIDEIRAKGWLGGNSGLLKASHLYLADLQKADLRNANLSSTKLWLVNLTGAILEEVNLLCANLEATNLSGAYLWGANLSGAVLHEANLSGANLKEANLSGAYLRNANLEDVTWNDQTILPDGTKWTAETNMAQFTDVEHPQYQTILERVNVRRQELGMEPLR